MKLNHIVGIGNLSHETIGEALRVFAVEFETTLWGCSVNSQSDERERRFWLLFVVVTSSTFLLCFQPICLRLLNQFFNLSNQQTGQFRLVFVLLCYLDSIFILSQDKVFEDKWSDRL